MALNNDSNFNAPLTNGTAPLFDHSTVQPQLVLEPNKLVSVSDKLPNQCDPSSAFVVPIPNQYNNACEQNGFHVNIDSTGISIQLELTPVPVETNGQSAERVAEKPHLALDSVARYPPPSPRRFVCVSVLQNQQSISSPSIGATNPNQEPRESLVGSGSCSGSEATLDHSPHTSCSSGTGPRHSGSRSSAYEQQTAEGDSGDENEREESEQLEPVGGEQDTSVEASERGDQFDSAADPHAAIERVARHRRSGLGSFVPPGARRHSAYSHDPSSKSTPNAVAKMRASSSATGGGSSATAAAAHVSASASRVEPEADDKERAMELSPNGRFTKLSTEVGRGSFKTVFKCIEAVTGIELAWCELMVRAMFVHMFVSLHVRRNRTRLRVHVTHAQSAL